MKKGIEYADKSWNPYTGCNGVIDSTCAVGKNCWAYKMSLRHAGRFGYDKENPFKPTIHEDKLDVPLDRKKPTRWDTCFMGDIAFCDEGWLSQILEVVRACPQHRFYFLTKRPDLLAEKDISFPDNAWVGVTVNSQDDEWRIKILRSINAKNLWISFEPLYGKISTNLYGIDWIVIGAMTNPEKQPDSLWVFELIRCARAIGIPVFIKPNITVTESIMELPPGLERF